MRLSIIIPIYNASATLERTLESLLRSVVPEHRAQVQPVLVDDGSTDDSGAIARAFVERGLFLSAELLRQDNAGSGAARNLGLDHATGDWVLFLDADDELVADPAPRLPDDKGVTSVISSVEIERANGRVSFHKPAGVTAENALDVLTSRNPFFPPCVVFRRDALVARFDPDCRYLEDWPFWVRNRSLFDHSADQRDSVIARIHAHGGNKSGQYERLGEHRQRIAGELLDELGDLLTRKQQNNLRVQAAIGRILAGGRAGWRASFRLPCSASLYGKFWVYALLRKRFGWIDIYGG